MVSSEGIEASAGSPTAREEIIEAVGGDWEISRVVRDLVEPTLDLSNMDEVADVDLSDMPEEFVEAFENISEVDATENEIDLKDPESGMVFSIGAADLTPISTDSGVIKAESVDGTTTSVSHITESGKGQVVVAVEDPVATFKDFTYELPIGYRLQPAPNGGFTLVNEAGEMEGRIDPAWAVDANGNRLPTRYELVGNNTLRQHVETQDAAFPVVMDPSWAWWVATTAACVAELAPLFVSGGAAIAARLPKLISFLNKLAKRVHVAKAIKKVGGVSKAAVAVTKKAYMDLRSKVNAKLRKHMPIKKLLKEEREFLKVAWDLIDKNKWDLIGIGSCLLLYNELRK